MGSPLPPPQKSSLDEVVKHALPAEASSSSSFDSILFFFLVCVLSVSDGPCVPPETHFTPSLLFSSLSFTFGTFQKASSNLNQIVCDPFLSRSWQPVALVDQLLVPIVRLFSSISASLAIVEDSTTH